MKYLAELFNKFKFESVDIEFKPKFEKDQARTREENNSHIGYMSCSYFENNNNSKHIPDTFADFRRRLSLLFAGYFRGTKIRFYRISCIIIFNFFQESLSNNLLPRNFIFIFLIY